MKSLFIPAYLIALLSFSPAHAGDVVLKKFDVFDYFSSSEGRWSGSIQATSTVQWPNWLAYQGDVAFDDVIESGFMLYRCVDCTGSDPDTHRFVFSGPATPQYPLLGVRVVITDNMKSGLFQRTWTITSAEDAIQTVRHFPFAGFTAVDAPTPLFPLGYTVTAHLADIDTIAEMLLGNFGPPLAHRTTQPCIPLREVQGTLFSTQCRQ